MLESGDISPILRNRTDHDPAIPGPSGLSKKTTLVFSTPAPENLKINGGDESDSESTSGCSLLVPQGEKVTESNYIVQRKSSIPLTTPTKVSSQATSPTSRRLPNPRPSNFTKLDLSTSKRPRFDSYVFHNSSLNKSLNASRTSLNDSLSSPFYKGRTMYGGASSYKEVLNVPLVSSKGGITRKVSVKPSLPTNASNERIGTAAARILKALEQFAAPVPEKKKPVGKSRSETRRRFQPYQELVIPQVPDLLRIKRKEKPLPPHPETSDVVDQAQPVETLSERLSAPAEESFVGCIRGRKHEYLETEKAKPVILPNIKLPITTLPNFTFTGLPKVTPSLKVSNPPVMEKKSSPPSILSTKVPSKPLSQYTFSKPIVESSDGHSVPSISPTFKFSEPLDANANEKIPNKMIAKNELKPKPEAPKKVENSPNGFGETFKAPKGGWECTTCLVYNSAVKQKCAACEMPKVAPPKPLVISTPDKWECKKCKLNNLDNETNCKSCGADKNGVVNAPLAKGFEEFLKKKTDTWECQECFVSNKNSDVSCIACSKAKPGAAPAVTSVASSVSTSSVTSVPLTITPSSTSVPLTSLFKKPEGNWECGICMVSNKSDVDACVACATPKPGAKVEKPAVTFQFGIPNSTEAAEMPKTSGFTFGIPDAKKEMKEPQFIATEFKFGIPSEKEKKDEKPSKRVSFGDPLVNEKIIPEPEVTFSFGNTEQVDTPQKQEENKPNEVKTNSLFQFGSSVTSEKQSSEKPNIFGNLNSTDKSDKNEMIFGSLNKTEVKLVEPLKNTFNEEPKKSIFGATPSFGENNVFGKKEPENVFGKESHVFVQKDAFNAEKPNSVFSNDKIGSNSLEFNKKPDENKVFAFGKVNSVVTENSVFNKTNADTFPSSSPKDEKVFAFGSRPQTNFFNNDKSVFGNKVENSEPKPVPTFGNAVNSSENKPFALNSNQGFNYFNKEEKQNTGGFNFNAPQQNTFAFGSAPAQTSTFTNPTPVQPSTFAFGSTHQEPQQQTMFGFQGQATTTPFAFGQNSLNQLNQSQPPVQQPPVQPPVFDPNVKPNFNFSGAATPLFSATPSVPSTGDAEPRKIRKAFRRFR